MKNYIREIKIYGISFMHTRRLIFISMLLLYVPGMAYDGKSHDDQPGVAKTELIPDPVTTLTRQRFWDRDYFPNVTLINEDGEKLKFFDDMIENKVVAINFIYTECPDSCPLETAQLKRVYDILGERVGKDVFFYSISIDAETDSPEVLKAYKQKFKIGSGWTFLTGNDAEIVQLRKKFGLYIDDLPSDADHNLSMIIGNQASGRWMKRSPFENPYVLATQLGDWLHNWKPKTKVSTNNYNEAPELRKFITGESLFRTRCSACHSYGSDGVGPDLMTATEKLDRNWLSRWIKEPDKMLAERDPLATALMRKYRIAMPNMRLSDQDVEAVIAYMEAQSERLKNTLD